MNSQAAVLNSAATPLPESGLEIERIRADFPILRQKIRGKPLIYLDNAATSQKPQVVLDTIQHFYSSDCSNVNRGVHLLSERATAAHENARQKVKEFINAAESREVIFVRGTTEAINLVAYTFARQRLKPGDQILITAMEHHSNIVPWQILRERGAELQVAPINDRGELVMDEFLKLLNPAVKLVCAAHVSNALGTVNPVREVIQASHERGIPVLVDGAQAVPHMRVDVQELDCDFYAFSGHKMLGPTGIGVLYGKAALLEAMPPFHGGGDMIRSVTFKKTEYNSIPHKFEGGTPNIAGAVGLGAAIDYMAGIGMDRVAAHERDLLSYGTKVLSEVPGLRIIGTARHKAGVISFVLDGVHPHDVGTVLDQEGIAVRTGHHCAQPVMERFGIPATTRASFALYNTRREIDALAAAIRKVKEIFA